MLKYFYRNIIPEEVRLHISARIHPIHNHGLIKHADVTNKSTFSMRKFDKLNSIFVHVTKTGGTAVAQALVGEQPYHYRAIEYRAIYGFNKYNKYFKFGFVRNPWSRLYSAWGYLKQGGWHDKDAIWYQDNISKYSTFESFVMSYLDNDNIFLHKHFWPQYYFLCNSNKQPIVDFIGRYETLNDDFDYIAKKLQIHNATLMRKNITRNNMHYRDIYTYEMIEKVSEIYNDDCTIFKYVYT